MKITANQYGQIQISGLHDPIELVTSGGSVLTIREIDGHFELALDRPLKDGSGNTEVQYTRIVKGDFVTREGEPKDVNWIGSPRSHRTD